MQQRLGYERQSGIVQLTTCGGEFCLVKHTEAVHLVLTVECNSAVRQPVNKIKE